MDDARRRAVARELAHDLIMANFDSSPVSRKMVASCLASLDATEEHEAELARSVTDDDLEMISEYIIRVAESIVERGRLARENTWKDWGRRRRRRGP